MTLPSPRPALTLTMLALCAAPLSHNLSAEDGTLVPVADPPAVQSIDPNLRHAQAEAAYAAGIKAREMSRLDDALHELRRAVDWEPDNQTYRKALSDTESLAGVARDSRSTAINRLADELSVRQQELKAEALSRVHDGTTAMEAGNFDEADRAFQQAVVRLESLPYADPTREADLRQATSLLNENRSRRAGAERERESKRNREALQQQQELRDLSLKIERDRIDAMLARAQRARERRDFDEAVLLCEQVLKLNRAEDRAVSLMAKCRRERHAYLRQVTADRWDEEHQLLTEQIRASMLPQLEIISYSSDWADIDARRSAPLRGAQGDDQQWRQVIQGQLDQELTVEHVEDDLPKVVATLASMSGATIILDPAVMKRTPPPPAITFKGEKMKLRFILSYLMKMTSLTYTLRNEAIYISSTEGARGDVEMRIYDVRDLTHEMKNFPGPDLDLPDGGANTGTTILPPIESAKAQETNDFIEIIKKVVAPDTWGGGGAGGAAAAAAAADGKTKSGEIGEYNGSMVVTNTPEVHRQIEELLRSLRNQKGTQIHVKVKFLEIENSALEQIGVDWRNFTGPNTTGPQTPGSAGSGVAPVAPVVGQNTAAGAPLFGAFYGNRNSNTNVAAGVSNPLLGYTNSNGLTSPQPGEGLTLQGQAWSIGNNLYASAVLNAVTKERRGNVLNEPDLTLFNGQQANLLNVHQQSYVGTYTVVQNQYQPTVQVLTYGTVLDVMATASADKKYITMVLRPTHANVRGWRRFGGNVASFPGGNVTQAGGAVGSQTDNNTGAGNAPLMIPEVQYQKAQTSVNIPDGGSLVLAGMTNGDSQRSHSGVPFLSHIPFLGRLFSTNGRQETLMKQMIVVHADVVVFEEIEKNL